MSKAAFAAAVSKNGVFIAALMANMSGVTLAQVQLWMRGISNN